MTPPSQRDLRFLASPMTQGALGLCLVPLLLFAAPLGARTIHVDHGADGSGSGSDWSNACPDLQTAIGNAVVGDQIWVAEGVYYPDEGLDQTPNDRGSSFVLRDGVSIYGGFAGIERVLTDRDPASRPTILSGDLRQNDISAVTTLENAYHVVTGDGTDGTAILDGFHISSGNANGPAPANGGGGLICHGSGTPTLVNCTFRGNLASDLGGAVSINDFSSPRFTNCAFVGNHATILGAGVCVTNSSTPSFINCTFAGNSATGLSALAYGGGVYASPSSGVHVVNGIFWGNSATSGGDQVYGLLDSASSHNLVGGSLVGGGVVSSADPLFVRDPTPGADGSWVGPADNDYGDLRLQADSPAYNTGLNAANSSSLDLSSLSRLQNGLIDLGAHETPFVQTVTTLNDSGEGSLRDAIAAIIAPGGGSIHFHPSLDGEVITLAGTQLLLDKSVVIDGSGLTRGISIDANGASRVFEITAGQQVYFDSFTITGGRTRDGADGAGGIDHLPGIGGAGEAGLSGAPGGGILNAGSLTLEGVTLTGNRTGNGGGGGDGGSGSIPGTGGAGGSGGSGGGIYNSGGLMVINSTLVDNHTGLGGNSGGGSGISEGGEGGSGGGIYNSGTLSLMHATITDNTTGVSGSGNPVPGGSGGGVKQGGVLHIENTLIAENSAIAGGVDLDGVVSEASGINCIGDPAGATGLGGGLLSGDPRLNPLGFHGGPTPTRPPLLDSPVVDPVGGDTFSRLMSDQRGISRIIGETADVGAVEIMPSIIVTSSGDSGPGTLRDAISRLGNGSIILFDPLMSGRTITLTSGELVIEKSLTIDASALSGGITVDAGLASRAIRIDDANDLVFRDVTLNGISITNGSVPENGGGIANRENLTLLNCAIISNAANGHGGGLWLALGSSHLEGCTISDNAASGPGGGGGIRLDTNASVVLLDSAFSGNSTASTEVTARGGGALVALAATTLSAANCSFYRNSSARKGGAASLLSSSASFTVCTFLENQSSGDGGGMHIAESSDPLVSNCFFMGNSADFGGAVYSDDSVPSFTNCAFSGNHAQDSGGAVSNVNSSGVIYTNCTFSGNHADKGGAISSNASTPTLTHCILWGNGAAVEDPQISGSVSETSSNNLIEGGHGDHVILSTDPHFARHADPGPDLTWAGLEDNDYGNFRLLDDSLAIGAGNNAAYDAVSVIATDLAGKMRKSATIDLGSYEGAHVTFPHLFPLLEPNADNNGNGRTNFMDYASGMDPRVPSSEVVQPALDGNQLMFHYRPEAVDAVPNFWKSTNLASWEPMMEGVDFTVGKTVYNGPRAQLHLDLLSTVLNVPVQFFRIGYSQDL